MTPVLSISLVTLCQRCDAQGGGSFIINKDEVEAVFKQGLEGLAQGKTVSDIVVRHVDVGVMQKVKPGDIAIIPKGMPHGWHEIVTDSIGYVIFRAEPNQVMNEKYE